VYRVWRKLLTKAPVYEQIPPDRTMSSCSNPWWIPQHSLLVTDYLLSLTCFFICWLHCIKVLNTSNGCDFVSMTWELLWKIQLLNHLLRRIITAIYFEVYPNQWLRSLMYIRTSCEIMIFCLERWSLFLIQKKWVIEGEVHHFASTMKMLGSLLMTLMQAETDLFSLLFTVIS